MYVIRPISLDDLDALHSFAQRTHAGITTLPKDRALLQKKIERSLVSFSKGSADLKDDIFVFVLEDPESKMAVGTCAIFSMTGTPLPCYYYRIDPLSLRSESLNVFKKIETLHLTTVTLGPSEIATLYLVPEHRKEGLGRLLSFSRFLFIAAHRHRFSPTMVVEMRGVSDEKGRSPFWEWVCRPFFDMDFPKADFLYASQRQFIEELMPRHPLYVPLLPKEVQEVIGKAHSHTEPAIKMLQDEGFAFSQLLGIFDAGPILSVPTRDIRTVRTSSLATVSDIVTQENTSDLYLISNERLDFRACYGGLVQKAEGEIILSRKVADALKVDIGAKIRYAAPR